MTSASVFRRIRLLGFPLKHLKESALSALLEPDFSVVIKSPPRMERYQSVLATPFRQGDPLTAGTRFPYSVTGALYTEAGGLIELSRRISGVAGDHVVLADPHVIEARSASVRLSGHGCYLGHLFAHYGHFITESLSTLWPLISNHRFDYFAAHPFAADALNENAVWTFSRFGIDSTRFHIIREQTVFEDLTIPERTWQPNRSVHSAYHDITVALSRSFWRNRRSRKMYLSRSNIANRAIENEPSIENYFRDMGYEVVHPETLSMVQQLELFGSCDILAGFSGSALHNILFCAPGTVVISLGDRRTRDMLLPNQRLCNAICSCQMALIPFSEGRGGFDLSSLKAALPAAEKAILSSR